MSIKGNWRRHGSEALIRWCQRFFFSPLSDSASPLNSVALNEEKTSGNKGINRPISVFDLDAVEIMCTERWSQIHCIRPMIG